MLGAIFTLLPRHGKNYESEERCIERRQNLNAQQAISATRRIDGNCSGDRISRPIAVAHGTVSRTKSWAGKLPVLQVFGSKEPFSPAWRDQQERVIAPGLGMKSANNSVRRPVSFFSEFEKAVR